jgi:hypothetical protein
VVNEVVETLTSGDLAAVDRHLAPDAAVRVVTPGGTERARGSAARELLARTLAEHRPFAGTQARGDVYPAIPTTAVVLSYEDGGGLPGDALLLVTFDGKLVVELNLHLLTPE